VLCLNIELFSSIPFLHYSFFWFSHDVERLFSYGWLCTDESTWELLCALTVFGRCWTCEKYWGSKRKYWREQTKILVWGAKSGNNWWKHRCLSIIGGHMPGSPKSTPMNLVVVITEISACRLHPVWESSDGRTFPGLLEENWKPEARLSLW